MTTPRTPAEPKVYGLMAEFLTPEEVLAAARSAYAQGYRQMDAYSPFPVEGLAEAIGFKRNSMPQLVLAGGVIGGLTGFGMQWYSAVYHYPFDIGGRPYFSWPAFIPVTFEMTVLFAAGAAVLGMLWLNGLPRPHHPVFNVPGFAMASRSRFFLVITSNDPRFDPEATWKFLEGLNPRQIDVIPS